MKIKKALVTSIDEHYKVGYKTGERYKTASLNVIESEHSVGDKKVIAYINKHTPALLIMALETGGYVYNFEVGAHPTNENLLVIKQKLPDDFHSSYDRNMPLMDNYEYAYSFLARQFGKEYAIALGKVLKIRQDRKDQYGDKYLEDTYDELVTQVNDKMKRVKLNVAYQSDSQYETALDAALDAVNYSIFIAAKIINDGK